MKYVLVALSLTTFIPVARANENLHCFGLGSFFGSYAGLDDGKNGPLKLQKFSQELPNASFESGGTAGHEKQKLTAVLKNQTVPLSDDGYRTADVRMVANFAYENGRIKDFDQTTSEVGGGIVSSMQYAYDWAGGNCRPSRIVVRDRRQLGQKRGVLFDKKLCDLMREAGVDGNAAEACVTNSKRTLAAMRKYDDALREATKGEEFLVSTNPYAPGTIVPTARSADNAVALNLMASCVALGNAGAPAKKAAAEGSAAASAPATPGGAAPAANSSAN